MSSSERDPSPIARPSRLMPLAVAGAAVLAVAGGALFYYASITAKGPEKGVVYKVTVGEKSCEPNDLTVAAGRVTFEIHNASNRPLEWEILDGVMVVEERENIAPGFSSSLTGKLKPGTYEITCGLLSNPRGTLVVTPSASSEAERAKPPVKAFIGPLSEYRVFVATQSSALVKETAKLSEALKADDLAAARMAYAAARLPYKRIESVIGRIADLENRIDGLADYLEKREDDPAFMGFHRIEYGLYAKASTEGLAPVGEALLADVTALKDRLKEVKLAPEDMVDGALRQARRLSEEAVLHGENRYSQIEAPEFAANLEGIAKSVTLMTPLVEAASADTAKALKDAIADTQAKINALGSGSYADVPKDARDALAASFADLAKRMETIKSVLGME